MMTNDKWTDDIRRQADGYKRQAPDGLLDDIKREMSRRGLGASAQKQIAQRRRVVIMWGRRMAVAAAFIAAVFLLINLMKRQPTQVARQDGATAGGSQPQTEAMVAEVSHGGESSAGHPAGLYTMTGRLADNEPEAVAASPLTAELQSAISAEPQSADNGADHEKTTARQGSRPQTSRGYDTDRQPYVHQRSGSRFALAASYSGFGAYNNGSLGNPAMADAMSDYGGLVTVPQVAGEMQTHAHHHMPVKVGIGLRYNINDRWSVQTGVNYTYLSADITRSNNLEETVSSQKLHYVSVPLTASYSVWRNNHVNVYVSAGGEAAKLVKGKADETHTVYGKPSTEQRQDIKEHRLQYSVGAAAGAELKLGNTMSVYAEPGVTHYFDNHSSVLNIYKDRPTQFTVNVGLRLNLNP